MANESPETDRLAALVGPPLARLGLDLEGLQVSCAGKRRVLRVAVDKDGGIDLDDVAEATRAVSGVLDEADAMGDRPYTLEVSSPGVDRPLTLPRHWRRNVGRLVHVVPVEGDPWTGRLLDAGEEEAGLSTGGPDAPPVRMRYADLRKATVEIEFGKGGR